MKTSLIAILLMLAPMTAFAQERKPRPVEPIRVTLTTVGDEAHTQEVDKLLRRALPRAVAVVSRRADYAIRIAVAPLTEDNQCRGVVGAMLVQGKDDEAHLSIYIGDGLQSLARQLAEKLQGFFQSRKGEK